VATLGYSRRTFVRFTTGEDALTLIGCLRAALLYFGGVPQQILFDNPKAVVVERDAYGEHRFDRGILDSAAFMPCSALRPGGPVPSPARD
jgi:transposase